MPWQLIFAIVAFFNLAVGLPLALQPDLFFTTMGQPVPAELLYVRVAGALIAVFGIGYAAAAFDPAANRIVIVLGALGKPIMPLILWFYLQAGAIPFSSFTVSLGDLFFAALFVWYLMTVPKARA